MTLLAVKELTVSYKAGEAPVKALDRVSFELEKESLGNRRKIRLRKEHTCVCNFASPS